MKKKIRKLAKKSGFIFWEEGEQGHSKKEIDWSCDYGVAFDRFCVLLFKEITLSQKKQITKDSK